MPWTWFRKPVSDTRPPWESGLSEEELAHEARISLLVTEYLTKPERRAFAQSDHAFHPLTHECVRCHITELEFNDVPFGIGMPCL